MVSQSSIPMKMGMHILSFGKKKMINEKIWISEKNKRTIV